MYRWTCIPNKKIMTLLCWTVQYIMITEGQEWSDISSLGLALVFPAYVFLSKYKIGWRWHYDTHKDKGYNAVKLKDQTKNHE